MKRSKLLECISALEKRTKQNPLTPKFELEGISTPKLFEYKQWLLNHRVLLKSVGR